MQPVEDNRPLHLIPYQILYSDGMKILGHMNFPRAWEGAIIQDDPWYQTQHPRSR